MYSADDDRAVVGHSVCWLLDLSTWVDGKKHTLPLEVEMWKSHGANVFNSFIHRY